MALLYILVFDICMWMFVHIPKSGNVNKKIIIILGHQNPFLLVCPSGSVTKSYIRALVASI